MMHNKNDRGLIRAWVCVIVWALFIFFMSAKTGSSLDSGSGIIGAIKRWLSDIQLMLLGPDIDIVSSCAHFCEYLVFGVLLAWALSFRVSWKRALVVAVVVASLYGITDEFHQYFVPDRMCDPLDWVVDTAGAFVGALICTLIVRKRVPLCDHL